MWIRHTVWKAPGQEAVGSLWCTLFDASWERPVAWKQTLPPEQLGVAPGEYLHIGDGTADALPVEGPSWRLEYAGDEEPFRYLPRDWMYRAKLPRTKAESLYPDVRFTGSVELDGRRLDLDGWPGMIGHNWGSEHAERWTWLHGPSTATTSSTRRSGGSRSAAGRRPWVGNALLRLDGEHHRLGGIERIRSTRVNDAPDRCAFVLPAAGGLRVEGEIVAPRPTLVGWVYSDPGGGQHHSVHSSIADLRLVIKRERAARSRADRPRRRDLRARHARDDARRAHRAVHRSLIASRALRSARPPGEAVRPPALRVEVRELARGAASSPPSGGSTIHVEITTPPSRSATQPDHPRLLRPVRQRRRDDAPEPAAAGAADQVAVRVAVDGGDHPRVRRQLGAPAARVRQRLVGEDHDHPPVARAAQLAPQRRDRGPP